MRDFDQKVETTYADLRPTDLIIDKAGNAWPIGGLIHETETESGFWLCDPVTKVQMHFMRKDSNDAVTVSRVPTHADEAQKLEADFPINELGDTLADVPEPRRSEIAAELAEAGVDEVDIADAVRGVEEILGGTVEAEVTAEDVDAAQAATEDAPVNLPAFDSMTPLEMRSHLYLLHGVYAADMKSRDETIAMHTAAHRGNADGSLKSAHVPHIHEEPK